MFVSLSVYMYMCTFANIYKCLFRVQGLEDTVQHLRGQNSEKESSLAALQSSLDRTVRLYRDFFFIGVEGSGKERMYSVQPILLETSSMTLVCEKILGFLNLSVQNIPKYLIYSKYLSFFSLTSHSVNLLPDWGMKIIFFYHL